MVGKIGTFLLWVLFLVLQTATRIVGSLLAGPAKQQEDPHQEPPAAAVARRRSPPASPHRDTYEPASAPLQQLWDPLPPSYSPSAPVADESSSSSSFRRRASAPLPAEDVVVSSSAYSRPPLGAAHAHSVSAPPLRETRAVPARVAAVGGKRPRLEWKYSKIVDQYRSLDEVYACAMFPMAQMFIYKGLEFECLANFN